jgi:hypothetical protein
MYKTKVCNIDGYTKKNLELLQATIGFLAWLLYVPKTKITPQFLLCLLFEVVLIPFGLKSKLFHFPLVQLNG